MLMARPRFTNKQGYLHAQRTQDNPRFKFTSHAITDAWFKSEMRFQMLLSNKLQKHIVQMLLHNRCPMALVRGGKRQQWVGAPWPSNAATVLLRLQYKAASTYGGVTPYNWVSLVSRPAQGPCSWFPLHFLDNEPPSSKFHETTLHGFLIGKGFFAYLCFKP